MDLVLCMFLVFILLLFLNIKLVNVEGYTSCIRKPSMRLYSAHFTHQFNELSILNNIDLANRAYRLHIPLKDIKDLIQKDKQKLIHMIMSKEISLFDKETKPKTKPKTNKETDKIRYVSGYSDPIQSYSGF